MPCGPPSSSSGCSSLVMQCNSITRSMSLKSAPAQCSVSFAVATSSASPCTLEDAQLYTSPAPSLTSLSSTSSLSLVELATPTYSSTPRTGTASNITGPRSRPRRRNPHPLYRLSSEISVDESRERDLDFPTRSLLFSDSKPYGHFGDSVHVDQIEIFAVDDPSSLSTSVHEHALGKLAAHEVFCEKFQEAWKLRTGSGILVPAPLDPPLPRPRAQHYTPTPPTFDWDMCDLSTPTPYPPLQQQRGFDAPTRTGSPAPPSGKRQKRELRPPSALTELLWLHRDDPIPSSSDQDKESVWREDDEKVVLRLKKTKHEKIKKRTRGREPRVEA